LQETRMKMSLIKLSKWKLIKKARQRWGRGEQFHNIKKKFNRKRNNQKIEGIVGDDEC